MAKLRASQVRAAGRRAREGTSSSRVPALPAFVDSSDYRGSHRSGGISVTALQVVSGLQKIVSRFPDWATPLNVASVLLWRLDQYRKDCGSRADMAMRAIERGDYARAARECYAIRGLCENGIGGERHNVAVSHDLEAARTACVDPRPY